MDLSLSPVYTGIVDVGAAGVDGTTFWGSWGSNISGKLSCSSGSDIDKKWISIKREKTLEKTRISSGNSYSESIRVFDFFSNFFLSFFALFMGKIKLFALLKKASDFFAYLLPLEKWHMLQMFEVFRYQRIGFCSGITNLVKNKRPYNYNLLQVIRVFLAGLKHSLDLQLYILGILER